MITSQDAIASLIMLAISPTLALLCVVGAACLTVSSGSAMHSPCQGSGHGISLSQNKTPTFHQSAGVLALYRCSYDIA
jgi:hypothetical protein